MDDDETTDFRGILGNLAAQPGGLLGGLFPPPQGYDPQQPGVLPPGADPTAISLAAAASASDLARTLRHIDHQAAIMAAFGKAMGAPGTRSAESPAQGGDAGPSAPPKVRDAPPPGPVVARRVPTQAVPAAPGNANAVFRRNPVPLPDWQSKAPQWPIPGTVEQRWAAPGMEIPDTSALLQSIAAVPSPTKPVADNLDWSTLPRGTLDLPPQEQSQAGVENPDTHTLLQDTSDIQSPPKPNLPALDRNHIDPDDLVSRIVRAESSGNAKAKSPSSSATGLAQFTDKTWLGQIRKYRPDLARWTPSDDELLKLRTNPSLQREMAAHYADENTQRLADAHLPISYGTIYLAHSLGPGNARKILRADPNASARAVVPDAIRGNEGFILPDMTVQQLIEKAEDVMQHGPRKR